MLPPSGDPNAAPDEEASIEGSFDTHIAKNHSKAYRRWRSVNKMGLQPGDYLVFNKNFTELGQTAKGQRMRERIKQVDQNGNGIIEKEEFLQMLELVMDEEKDLRLKRRLNKVQQRLILILTLALTVMTFLTSYLAIWLTKEMTVNDDGALTNTAGDVVLKTAQATKEDTGGLETLFEYAPRDYQRVEMDVVFLDQGVAEHTAISRQVFSVDQHGCLAADVGCAERVFTTLAGDLRVVANAEEFVVTVDGRPARLLGPEEGATEEQGAVTVVVEAGKRRRLHHRGRGGGHGGSQGWGGGGGRRPRAPAGAWEPNRWRRRRHNPWNCHHMTSGNTAGSSGALRTQKTPSAAAKQNTPSPTMKRGPRGAMGATLKRARFDLLHKEGEVRAENTRNATLEKDVDILCAALRQREAQLAAMERRIGDLKILDAATHQLQISGRRRRRKGAAGRWAFDAITDIRAQGPSQGGRPLTLSEMFNTEPLWAP